MKKILIISSILLTACVNLQFDSLEYDHYINIKEIADSASILCGNPAIQKDIDLLKQVTDHQYVYSTNREARPQVADAAKNLKEIVDTLYARYQQPQVPSKGYCQEKLKNVSLGAITVVRALGRL